MDNYTFEIGKPIKCTLKYDKPTPPAGEYNTQYWGTEEGPAVRLTPGLLQKMQQLDCKKGDVVIITKVQMEGSDHTVLNIVKDTEPNYATKDEEPTPGQMERPSTDPDWDLINGLKQFQIQKGECLKLAVHSLSKEVEIWDDTVQEELSYRLDRLMNIITDDFSRAKGLLMSAIDIPNLESIWRKYESIWKSMLTESEMSQLVSVAGNVKNKYFNGE